MMKLGKTRYMEAGAIVKFAQYGNGQTAILGMLSNGGVAIKATVNLEAIEGAPVPAADEVIIKTWGENEGMVEALLAGGVIEPPRATFTFGRFDTRAAIARLTPAALALREASK
jgi:hypothetical protein